MNKLSMLHSLWICVQLSTKARMKRQLHGTGLLCTCHTCTHNNKVTQTARHVPDSLGVVFFQPLADGNINVSAMITGQSRSAPESTWVQRGGLEIPCFC